MCEECAFDLSVDFQVGGPGDFFNSVLNLVFDIF